MAVDQSIDPGDQDHVSRHWFRHLCLLFHPAASVSLEGALKSNADRLHMPEGMGALHH